MRDFEYTNCGDGNDIAEFGPIRVSTGRSKLGWILTFDGSVHLKQDVQVGNSVDVTVKIGSMILSQKKYAMDSWLARAGSPLPITAGEHGLRIECDVHEDWPPRVPLDLIARGTNAMGEHLFCLDFRIYVV
jgi:hypothetical protein